MLRNDIGAINKDLAQLNDKINEFVDTGIKERVHNEVNAIIEKMVSSKKYMKPKVEVYFVIYLATIISFFC